MSVKWALRSGFMPKVSMLGSRAQGLPGRPGPASTSQSHVGLELESGSQHCRTVPSRCASCSSQSLSFPGNPLLCMNWALESGWFQKRAVEHQLWQTAQGALLCLFQWQRMVGVCRSAGWDLRCALPRSSCV